MIGENKPVPSVLGMMCIPSDETLSSTPIDWGDGTTSPAVIRYEDTNGGTKQAWLDGGHSYPRATCPTGFCRKAYRVSATLTDDQTGQVFALHENVEVAPILDVISLAPVRSKARRLFRGKLATVHTGGLRFLGEMTATVDWDDGTRSVATVTGAGQDFVVKASHRWRKPGTYNVALYIRDGFTRERMLRYLRGHVSAS